MGVIRDRLERYTGISWNNLGETVEDIISRLSPYINTTRDHVEELYREVGKYSSSNLCEGGLAKALNDKKVLGVYGLIDNPQRIQDLGSDMQTFYEDNLPPGLLEKAIGIDTVVSISSLLQIFTRLGTDPKINIIIEGLEGRLREYFARNVDLYFPESDLRAGLLESLYDLGTITSTLKDRREGKKFGFGDFIRLLAELPDVGFKCYKSLGDLLYERFARSVYAPEKVEETKGEKEELKPEQQEQKPDLSAVLRLLQSLGLTPENLMRTLGGQQPQPATA